MLIKGKKIKSEGDEYYLEFFLSEVEKAELIAQLCIQHVKNHNELIFESEPDVWMKRIDQLRNIVEETPDMSKTLKESYYKMIVEIHRERQREQKNKEEPPKNGNL